MKRNIFFYSFLFLIALSFSACKKENTKDTSVSEEQAISTQLSSGTWRVSYFLTASTDKTAEFNDFKFTFNTNGNVAAANSLLAENGSWRVLNNNGAASVTLDFSGPDTLQVFLEITGGFFRVLSHSDTRIDMERLRTDGGTDHLTIERI